MFAIIPSSHFSAPPVTDDVPKGVTTKTRNGTSLFTEFSPVLPTNAVYRQMELHQKSTKMG
ncbi:MAG TPA: hypothetical protein DEW39_10435 [Brevibacterium sp.]|uniref:Uncharacterized protein n=1 Tax=Brevibacterium antiquum CNRZ 918 TaxID=1255637 RepID=A0A2H1KZM9_9MICO|nr:hypothetical protein BANT918_03296 [Brevibacterium antiquum CNRZ 918]HCG56532.1 hypothetical protein [Brevibacterium sp.]